MNGVKRKDGQKNPFSLNFSPQSRRQHFLRKIYLPDLQQSLPAGAAAEHCSSSRSPISPSSSPSPPPLLPRLPSTQSCLCLLPATTQKFWPQSLRALWLLSTVDLIAMQKGDFLEFMPQMFPVGTTRPVLTEKVETCSNFYNLEAKIWGTSSSSSEE